MTRDTFVDDDAAYVLGALSPAAREAYEDHLRSCPDCTARVTELAGMPGLLGTIDGTEPTSAGPPVPDSQLPSLLRRIGARHRRQRRVIAALAGVAAACVLALAAVLVLPAVVGPDHSAGRSVAMTAVPGGELAATARFVDRPAGTTIELRCRARAGATYPRAPYRLTVTDTDGAARQVAAWRSDGQQTVTVEATTQVRLADIRSVAVTTSTGRPVLRLVR